MKKLSRKNMEIKYPSIKVPLVGQNGNAFSIIGRTERALYRYGVSKEERDQYIKEATSGNYDNVLATTMHWVNTEDDD